MNKSQLTKTQKDSIKKLNDNIQSEKDFISNMAAQMYVKGTKMDPTDSVQEAVNAAIMIRDCASQRVFEIIQEAMKPKKSPIDMILGEKSES